MYAVVRRYHSRALMDEFERHDIRIRRIISGISGFVSYTLARTSDGGFSLSVYQNQEGAAESNTQIEAFIRDNLPEAARASADISEGSVLMQFATDLPPGDFSNEATRSRSSSF